MLAKLGSAHLKASDEVFQLTSGGYETKTNFPAPLRRPLSHIRVLLSNQYLAIATFDSEATKKEISCQWPRN
jgi:hypothetical protein